MNEMEAAVSRKRRVLTGAAVLAIAAGGVAWGGCGNDDANDAIDQAQEELSTEGGDTADKINEAVDAAQEGDTDAAQEAAAEAAQEATDQANEALDNATTP
jgi:hypothetical protein